MLSDRQKAVTIELLSTVQLKPGQSALLKEIEEIILILQLKPESIVSAGEAPESPVEASA